MSENMFAASQADNRLGLSDVTPWTRARRAPLTAAARPETPAPAPQPTAANEDKQPVTQVRAEPTVTTPPVRNDEPRQDTPAPAAATAGYRLPQNETHTVTGGNDVRPEQTAEKSVDRGHAAPPRPSYQLPRESMRPQADGQAPAQPPQQAAPVTDPVVPQPEYRTPPAQPAQPASYTFRQPARPAMETVQPPALAPAPQQVAHPPVHTHVQAPVMHTTYLQAEDDSLYALLETLDNRVTSMEQAISDLRRERPAADGSMLRPVEKAVQRLAERMDRLDGGTQNQIGFDDEQVRARPRNRKRGGVMNGLMDFFRR